MKRRLAFPSAIALLVLASAHGETPRTLDIYFIAGEVNTVCGRSGSPPGDPIENPRSTGVVVAFGKFRFLDVGDLTGQPLFQLACPDNLIGAVDVYLVAHSRLASPCITWQVSRTSGNSTGRKPPEIRISPPNVLPTSMRVPLTGSSSAPPGTAPSAC
jgi:hypothetical protein